jgi:F420 biosynthesis protein FbiB-like protein
MKPQLLVEETMSIEGTHSGEWTTLRHIIGRRRSIRRYTSQPIPDATLLELLDAATLAPSAHNRQPWRFCVVTGDAAKTRLSMAMGEQWRADLRADNADPAFIERRVAISHARMTGAAALVVASLTMSDMDRYPDPIRAQAEWTMAVQSVALACQNLLLAAEAQGIGACWMCAPLFVPELVRQTLALPADWEPQALITLGYPAESKTKERASLESRVLWR